MSEVLKNKGRLAVFRDELAVLESRIRAGIAAVRNNLDPHEAIEDLKAEEAAIQAVDLAEIVAQWREKQAQIRAIEKELGR